MTFTLIVAAGFSSAALTSLAAILGSFSLSPGSKNTTAGRLRGVDRRVEVLVELRAENRAGRGHHGHHEVGNPVTMLIAEGRGQEYAIRSSATHKYSFVVIRRPGLKKIKQPEALPEDTARPP